MSVSVLTEVWASSLPSATHKLVLLAFADHVNREGRCWPSMRRIAWKTGLSRRQTRRIVQDLITSGALEVISESRPRRSRRYRVRTDRLPPLPDQRADTGDPSEWSNRPLRKDTTDPPEGTPVSPEPSKEPSREPTNGTGAVRSIITTLTTDSGAKGYSRGSPDDQFDRMRRRYENDKRGSR